MSEEENKIKEKWKVVGYNTLALMGYTLLCRFVSGGIIFDCVLVGIHFLIAMILSISLKKLEWLFSALIIIIVGFSTCIYIVGSGPGGKL